MTTKLHWLMYGNVNPSIRPFEANKSQELLGGANSRGLIRKGANTRGA